MNSPRHSNPASTTPEIGAGPLDSATKLATTQAVVCLSGGMDSTSLMLHLLARDVKVFGVSFDYGQKHRLELDRLKSNLEYLARRGLIVEHTTIDLSALGGLFHSALTTAAWEVPEGYYEEPTMKATVVPNRNSIFSSIAFGYALSLANRSRQPVAMALGVHSGDHAIYPDCRPSFYAKVFAAFAEGNWEADRVGLYLPYLQVDKTAILRDAQSSVARLNLDFETVFRNTNTSYDPDEAGRSRGKTGADVERILAFAELGIPDPVPYTRPWEEVLADARRVASRSRAASQRDTGC